MNCLRSAESCKALNCKEDEECFLKQVVDLEKNSVAVTAVCGKRNPCTADTCKTEETCVPLYCGLQPPTAKCEPNTFADPCNGVTCPDGYLCSANSAFCSGIPCNTEVVCADFSACKNCSFTQVCDTEPKDGSDSKPRLFVGKCVAFALDGPLAAIQETMASGKH